MKPDVSIIIVSWNVRELLGNCLRSLEETRDQLQLEIFVVDNNSGDGSATMVREQFPHVILEALPDNTGFARANNRALARVAAPFIMLLNPDTRVLPGALQTLLTSLKSDPTVGAMGPQLVNAAGETDPSCRRFPTMPAAFHQFTLWKYFFIFGWAYDRYMMKEFSHQTPALVDQIMGACMLVRRDILTRVGFLDEDFFIFYEEVDWCRRIKEAGFSIGFEPAARIVHISDQSTTQVWDAMLYQKVKSLFHYFSKTRPTWRLSLFKPVFKAGVLAKLLKDYGETWIKYQAKSLFGRPGISDSRAEKYRQRSEQTGNFLKNYTGPLLKL